MGTFLGGLAAMLVGAGLATVTVFGVVQSQSDNDPEPVEATVVSYGTNN